MTIFSHIIATYILGKVLKVKTLKNWFLLWIFGVLIDLDTVFFRPGQVFNPAEWYYHYDTPRYLRTFIQEPVFLLFIIPFSYFILKSLLPIYAFSLHLFMDYIEIKIKKPFSPFSDFIFYQGLFKPGSKLEIALSTFLLLVLCYDQAKKRGSGCRTFFKGSSQKIRKIWP